MKTLRKILIGVGIALIVGFMSLVIYYIYQDSLNEKKLSNEFDEIDSLLTNSDIHNDLIDIKLNETVSNGDYKIVEEVVKNYLKEVIDVLRDFDKTYNDDKFLKIINFEYFDENYKYINDNINYLENVKLKTQNFKDSFYLLFDEDNINNRIKEYKLDSYYIDYYKNIMTGLSDYQQDIDNDLKYVIDVIDGFINYYSFLNDNSSHWIYDGNYIIFDNDSLTNEYNRLIKVIENIGYNNQENVV